MNQQSKEEINTSKTAVDFLNEKLVELNIRINEHQESLEVGKKWHLTNPKMFTAESIDTLSEKINIMDADRTDLEAAINQTTLQSQRIAELEAEVERMKSWIDLITTLCADNDTVSAGKIRMIITNSLKTITK